MYNICVKRLHEFPIVLSVYVHCAYDISHMRLSVCGSLRRLKLTERARLR